MGNKNCVTKEYMKDNERFADVFNYLIFNGKRVIKSEDLKEKDPTETIIIKNNRWRNKNKFNSKEKYRDILKECVIKDDGQRVMILLGIENQSYIDYAMPIRDMLYDAINYSNQVSQRGKTVRKRKDISEDEFLSGFCKYDKVKPIITLVIYFGDKKWDGPRSLHEMINTDDENVLKCISDYKLNLIIPQEIEDFSLFSSNFRYLMEILTKTDSKEEVERYINENEEYFHSIDPDEAWAINSCADLNIEINEKEGKVNMCKAIEDMKKESEAIGMEKGVEIGRREKEKEMCKAIEDMKKESEAIGIEKGVEIGMEKAISVFVLCSKNKGESKECIISDLISFYDLPEEKAIYYYDSAVEKTA